MSRSSLYYVPQPPDAERLRLRRLVDGLCMAFPCYGTRRVNLHRRRQGEDVGRGLARTLMAEVCWRTVYPRPRTSRVRPGHKIYPYLLNDPERIAPGGAIRADIT